MVDSFVCKKRRTTNELLADNEITRKRLGIMFHFKKIKKSKLLENLNDTCIISMPKFVTLK